METQLMRDLIHTMMQGRQALKGAFHDSELTMAEFIALSSIEHNTDDDAMDNVYADDLRHNLYVSKPAISQMLKSLEKAGYIRREINPLNRRKLTVTLTDEGRALLDRTVQRYEDRLREIIEAFGMDKTLQLVSLFTEFMAVVQDINRD